MHAKAFVTAAVVAASLGAGGLTAAQSHHPITQTFIEVEEAGNYALADLGPASEPNEVDVADVIALTSTLTVHGRSVGHVHMAGIGVDHTRHLTQSTGTIRLSDGTVDFAGLVPTKSHFDLAVTGGTGRYAGYEGTVTLDFGSKNRITMRLDK